MKEDIVIEHLMEIKERLSTIEEKVAGTESLEKRFVVIEQEQIKTEASAKTLRRVVYFMLFTAPAGVAAVVKILKG